MTTHIQRCYLCDSTENIVGTCARCNKCYCTKDVSRIDPQYCDDCMRDVEITETIFSRSETEYNEDTDSLITSTQRCKQINFKGIDWMFASKHISELTDDELKPTLEYHRAFVYQLESEIVNRTIKKQKQVLPSNIQTTAKVVVQKSTVIRTKTTKPIDLESLVNMAVKLGLTSMDDIKKFLAGNQSPAQNINAASTDKKVQ